MTLSIAMSIERGQ